MQFRPLSSIRGLVLAAFLVGAAVLSVSCAGGPAPDDPLRGGWKVAVGSAQDTPKEAEARVFMDIRDLSELAKYLPATEGYLWIKREFQVPPRLRDKELGLLLGRISMVDRTWLNGRLLGGKGELPPKLWSAWNETRMYDLSEGSLDLTGSNTLLIKVYGQGEAAVTGTLMLDERGRVERVERRDTFMATEANAIIAFLLLVIGLYHFVMWLLRRAERENLWYGLMCLLFAAYQLNFFITLIPGLQNPGWNYDVFQRFVFISLFLVMACFAEFVREFLRITDPRPVRIIRLLATIVPALINLVPISYGIYRHSVVPVTQAFMLLMMGYIIFLIIYAIAHRNREAYILMVGFIPTAAAALFDLIVQQLLQVSIGVYFAGLGFPLFLLAVLFILAHRFVGYQNDLYLLNATLEQKVTDRTRELSEANVQLDQSNHTLSTTVQQLEAARAVAAKDMAMAISVRNSILPKAPPRSPDWDIAFTFKPMAGVSGDFYDFYEFDGKLRGASIFDVSGHGIASSLITMIGRSVIMGAITKMRKVKLDEVINHANQELIAQIGNTDNYLTGIVLRFWDDVVEYLNAGHPDLLYRRAESASVTTVNRRDRDVKGRFLGIDALESVYSPMSFRVFPNDLLLLYTDCLVEARNPEGEEYGQPRLMESLRTAPASDAQAALDHVLSRFKAFVGVEEFQDDLTVIVVRRRSAGEDWQHGPDHTRKALGLPEIADEEIVLDIQEG